MQDTPSGDVRRIVHVLESTEAKTSNSRSPPASMTERRVSPHLSAIYGLGDRSGRAVGLLRRGLLNGHSQKAEPERDDECCAVHAVASTWSSRAASSRVAHPVM